MDRYACVSGDWDEDDKLLKFVLVTGDAGERTPGRSQGAFFPSKVCHHTANICSDGRVFIVCYVSVLRIVNLLCQ